MARGLNRGEVWLHRFAPPGKRRPVVILSRSSVIPFLHSVIVAPVTSTIRDLPSEVRLDVEHGMKGPCVISLDHVTTVHRADLLKQVATLPAEVMHKVCAALAVATGCG